MNTAIVMKPQTISKGRLWVALIALLLGQFVVTIDLTVLNIALPEITKELKPTSDQLLWTVDIYSLVLAGLLIATSSLSDRLGRKITLLVGFLIFGVGSALVVFVDDPGQLIALRAFLGIGGAMIMPVTISMIRSIFIDSKERAVAVAAWSAVSAIGMAAGPLIGGFLLEHFNWHSAFFVNIPLVGLALVIGIFALPEVRLKNPGRFDFLAALIALAGMGSLLWGIKHLAAELAFDIQGIAAVIVGLALMGLFIFRCLKSKEPIVDLSLFKNKTFTAGVIATTACTFAMAVLLYMLAQWLQLVNGDGTLESGIKLVPMSVAALISSAGAAALAMRYQARNVVAGGLVVAAGAMLMLLFFRENLTVVPVIVSTCLVGLGMGSLAIGASLIMAETPVEKASSAASLQEISYDLGNVLGVAILGSLASIIYRAELGTGQLRAMGFDSATIDAVKQSFAVAVEISKEYGIPELFKRGAAAFNESLVITCVVGGIIILVTAFIVWRLIPKGMKITEDDDSKESSMKNSFPSPAEGSLSNGLTPATNASLAHVLSEVDMSMISIPLDTSTMQEMEAVCKNLGIDVTTAFTFFARKVAKEGRLSLEASTDAADATFSNENLAHINRNVTALDEGRGVMHESDNTIKIWAPEAWEDYLSWKAQNAEVHSRIKALIESIEKDGASGGIGDPERIRSDFPKLWARRINDENLLIYRIEGDDLQVIACKNHYDYPTQPE